MDTSPTISEKKLYGPEFMTPQERQDRVVELLTRGLLRMIEAQKSQVNTAKTPK